MTEPIARAIEAIESFDVAYETTPTDTVIEAATLEELFAAVRAAHEAIADRERVVTELQIDYQPRRDQRMDDRVEAVEAVLGRPPRRDRRQAGQDEPSRYDQAGRSQHGGQQPTGVPPGRGSPGAGRRYGSRRH